MVVVPSVVVGQMIYLIYRNFKIPEFGGKDMLEIKERIQEKIRRLEIEEAKILGQLHSVQEKLELLRELLSDAGAKDATEFQKKSAPATKSRRYKRSPKNRKVTKSSNRKSRIEPIMKILGENQDKWQTAMKVTEDGIRRGLFEKETSGSSRIEDIIRMSLIRLAQTKNPPIETKYKDGKRLFRIKQVGAEPIPQK